MPESPAQAFFMPKSELLSTLRMTAQNMRS
jgi:hypothetical protein